MEEDTPVLGHFGRSLSSLFTQCASPGRIVVLSIDDITNGDSEYLLDSNKKGGPVAMLKWAKGSKHGGHHGPGHHGSAARVSLADLRRASAKLLRRKDSSSSKSKSQLSDPPGSPALTKTGTNMSSVEEDGGNCSPPPPLVPPRGSSVASSIYGGSTTIIRTPTPASSRSTSVIKQATVRRMSTLRQARSTSPVDDSSRRQPRRPASSSSSSSSTCSTGRINERSRRKPPSDTGDNSSSLYMQLDKIPVAVQQVSSSLSGSVFMAAANLKRKALEDISNQAYRQIIHSLQDELAQMSDAEAEAQSRADSADETRTLAEATLLPMNQLEIMKSSSRSNHSQSESNCQGDSAQHGETPLSPPAVQTNQSQQQVSKQLDTGLVASFTNQPPVDLHRPRAVRHPSPTSESGDLTDATTYSRTGLSTPTNCHPFNGTSSPLKKVCHTSTGQHLHQYGPARSLNHELTFGGDLDPDHQRLTSPAPNSNAQKSKKKSRTIKQVTFQAEARLIGEAATLPVVFESDQEDSGSLHHPSVGSETEPLMPGFVNVPCSRRGFCLELDSTRLPDVTKLDDSSMETTVDEVDHCSRRLVSPDGYDWQPSYVNLEDTEIAPVLLASSRPADDSSDFWKPRSVASGQRQQVDALQPVYDAPANSKMEDHPLLLEFPGFRYAIQLPGNVLERRSISNGSSGSDTQDSGVAEMAQALSLSRAASASPQLAASSQSLAEDTLLAVQPFVYNTLPRTDSKRNQYYNCWAQMHQQQSQDTSTKTTTAMATSSVYSTTDPHFLSALASPYFSRRVPDEEPPLSPSSSALLMPAADNQDSSWSSDHLYCNMASVDPLPSLPPRISRRCHSLLALASTKASTTEDADYENLNMPSNQPGQPAMAFKARLNISHSRSRSLRHSGDFTNPFGWTIPPYQQQQQQQIKAKEPEDEKQNEEMEVKHILVDDRRTGSLSARRQQLIYERAHRLELMLNDASVNDCSELYEPSDWSMEAMLSDTVRDMDNFSLDGPESHCHTCQHCCCASVRRPAPPQCRCHMVIINHSSSSSSSTTSSSCHCRKKKQTANGKSRMSCKVRENAATQTEQNGSPLARTAAAENPLYMAYNDLTKIDDLDRTGAGVNAITTAVQQQMADDYASDGCETWNSHRALYARLQAAKQSQEAINETQMKKKRATKGGRHHHHHHHAHIHHHKPAMTPSSSRIWRHEGQSVSTPQKNRRPSGRRRSSRRRDGQSTNTTANSSKLDRTAMSTRSTLGTKGSTLRRCKSSRRPKAADVLHGKGQLQLAIYLNSGLLTIHIQSARYLRSNNGKPSNSYVKVSLIPDGAEQTFCRTTLVKNDNNPWYDQKFSFEFLSADLYKRLFISVWNRDAKKKSDFMGCMSFSVSHVIRKDASGWYRLLNGNIGRQRHFAVKKQIDFNNSTIVPTDPDMEEDLVVVDDSDLDNGIDLKVRAIRTPSPSSAPLPTNGSNAMAVPIFPVHEMKGKTPYTTTMNLKRGPKGYGFSVTWTHPPRIERVEPGLAADMAGMRVADYIVFVGSHNVVKMDEEQVLQLIQSAGDTLTLEIYRKTGSKSSGCGPVTSEQLTATELQQPVVPNRPTTNSPESTTEDSTVPPSSVKTEIHRAKHGLINAETAMTLAVHRLLNTVQNGSSQSSKGVASTADKSRAVLYLSKLEKMGEEHVDYMIMANQLRSFNIHTTPLMIASELHKLKKLLDRINEHLPAVVADTLKGSVDHEILSDQYHSVFLHLNDIYGFLKKLNQMLKKDDRVDYFLDAFQISLDKLHFKVQEVLTPRSVVLDTEGPNGRVPLIRVEQKTDHSPQQNIVYAASIRQPKLHSNVNDGCLMHQGFMWKRNGSSETRFWALLFTDALLLTHVNNGVHFVQEEPILLRHMVRLLADENHLNPAFRLVYRANNKSRFSKVSSLLGCTVVTMRAKDWTQKVTWVDLIRRQIDDLQNREHYWNTASLCDKNQPEGHRENNGLAGSGIGILRRVHRCLSSGAIPIPTSMTISSSSTSQQPPTDEPTFYQSYSCDDLYLVSDLTLNRSTAVESITELQEPERSDSDQRDEEGEDLVFQEIDLSTPAQADQDNLSTESIDLNRAVDGNSPVQQSVGRKQPSLHERLFRRAGKHKASKTSRSGSVGVNSTGTVREPEPGRQCVGTQPSSVLHVSQRTAGRIQGWTSRFCCALLQSKPVQTSEIASATIYLDEAERNQPDWARSPKTNTFQSVLDTIAEDDGSGGVEHSRMRQFQSSMNTDERHVLHSTGDSTETSPSWASATSSAMETPNDVDQPLAFDFSRKCELNSDGRQQLVLPKSRAGTATSPRSSSGSRAPGGSIPVSFSMPTTPEMSEASPSPRQASSAGFFRFPFVGNASPRRFRSRAMSAESNTSHSDDIGPSLAGSSSPPATASVSVAFSPHSHDRQDPQAQSQQSGLDRRLRFPRFLRRTHSASASTTESPPPYALFLRTKRMVSKTRSADLAVAASANEVFSSSVDDSSSAGAMASRKTRLSEMRLRLGFLRRRSTESSLSARPPPEEAQKWSESFTALMASKYGAALYRAFLLREFSNENLEFWLACEDYKNSKPQKMAAKAQKIYNDFVAVQAPKEVNLDAETRLITLTNVQSNNPDPHAFDRAQRRIQHMMERDSYLRFLQSELFLELVHPERYPAATADVSDKSSSGP